MEQTETPVATGAHIDSHPQLYPDPVISQEQVVADHVETSPKTPATSEAENPGFTLPEPQSEPSTVEKVKSTVEQPTQKEMLLALSANVDLWRDPDGEPHATIDRDTGSVNVKVRGKDFRDSLCWTFYNAFRTVPSSQALEDVIRTLEGKAKFDSPEFETHIRVAGDATTSYLHLADRAGTIVRVTGAGVEMVQREEAAASIPTLKFLVKSGMRSLPSPVVPSSLEHAILILGELRTFCNLRDDSDWLLFLVSLLSSFRPTGPFVVVVVVGEQGSAKSTLCKIFRRLVDPSAAPLRSAPREERDLWIAANNGWIVVFDNVSHISGDLSDAVCRLATGGGNSYRALYENDAETLFQAQRLVMLNTIDDLTLRGDLVDRSVQLNCKRIEDKDRKTEADFWDTFEQRESNFLGALLMVLSHVLKELPNVRLEESPRMADFARFGVAVERALALPMGTFLSAYNANRKAMSSVALENQFTQLLLNLDLPIETTASDLWQLLLAQTNFAGDKIPRWFPGNGQQLSGRLRRMSPLLRQQGISIEFRHSGRRSIQITKAPDGGAQ